MGDNDDERGQTFGLGQQALLAPTHFTYHPFPYFPFQNTLTRLYFPFQKTLARIIKDTIVKAAFLISP